MLKRCIDRFALRNIGSAMTSSFFKIAEFVDDHLAEMIFHSNHFQKATRIAGCCILIEVTKKRKQKIWQRGWAELCTTCDWKKKTIMKIKIKENQPLKKKLSKHGICPVYKTAKRPSYPEQTTCTIRKRTWSFRSSRKTLNFRKIRSAENRPADKNPKPVPNRSKLPGFLSSEALLVLQQLGLKLNLQEHLDTAKKHKNF